MERHCSVWLHLRELQAEVLGRNTACSQRNSTQHYAVLFVSETVSGSTSLCYTMRMPLMQWFQLLTVPPHTTLHCGADA
eukprot:14249-Heterococcus_DN1.PRE.5